MKKFLKKVFLSGIACAAVMVLGLVVRVTISQAELNGVFGVPDGTEVLCIGNSHTGCTWYEAPEFKNRVFWSSATGFATHYMRFREFERRGVLDSGIRYCILDCDGPSMTFFSTEELKMRFGINLPFAWRYADCLPVGLCNLALYVLGHSGHEFYFTGETPPGQVAGWTTRTKQEQELNIARQYCKDFHSDWKTGYPEGWQDVFLWMVGDIKNRCDAHGVRLICFAAPLTSASPARTNRMIWERESRMIDRVKAIGVEYYDFRLACADCRFRDSHHLLRDYSYEFTKRFFCDVLKLSKIPDNTVERHE